MLFRVCILEGDASNHIQAFLCDLCRWARDEKYHNGLLSVSNVYYQIGIRHHNQKCDDGYREAIRSLTQSFDLLNELLQLNLLNAANTSTMKAQVDDTKNQLGKRLEILALSHMKLKDHKVCSLLQFEFA